MTATEPTYAYYCTCPPGLESLLAEELRALGAEQVHAGTSGCSLRGDLAVGYRVCLWSRLAGRVLLHLGECAAGDSDSLYRSALALPWERHLTADTSFAVHCNAQRAAITHSHYAALKLKDAVVDRLREALGRRPDVELSAPDLRLHLHLHGRRAQLALDLAGPPLHQRGYRSAGGEAPLKENLAAGLLRLAGWPERCGPALVDPMCGSGTLLLEGALMAADAAPGLTRQRFGFERWPGHQPALWSGLLAEARERRERGLRRLPPIQGSDRDPQALAAARANARNAGLEAHLQLECRPLTALAGAPAARGLLVCNPPYGQRLDAEGALARTYAELGRHLSHGFAGWQAAVFTAVPQLLHRLRLPARRSYPLRNGALACRLTLYDIPAEPAASRSAPAAAAAPPVGGGEMLANRLHKNLRHLGRWARRHGVACYRLYDADLPEFALALDLYAADQLHLLAQEYRAPAHIDPALAEARLALALRVAGEVLEVPGERIHLRRRQRQRGAAQYARQGEGGELLTVREGGHRLLVNLDDYLDSGLFLDHRITRGRLQREAAGGDFLNLFAYTASATVYAAAGGARSTTSVDLSPTYLSWARRNLALNGFDGAAHRLVQADCMAWLREQPAGTGFDLIFVDPPTFSNSKRTEADFDVQRDHAALLQAALALLRDGGALYFSSNARRFKLDPAIGQGWQVRDISRQTLPEDFRRNPRIHRCWRFSREGG